MAEWSGNLHTICLFFIPKMLKLILTRHAKSSWDDPLLYDHDRPLNARGVRSARVIGNWIKARGDAPGMILTSSATRAQMTAEIIAETIEFKSEFQVESGLYHASTDTILKHLCAASEPVVLMVGHNPGIADFAARVLSEVPDHPRFFDYPTAATLVAHCDMSSWTSVRFGALKMDDFVVPKDLDAPEGSD